MAIDKTIHMLDVIDCLSEGLVQSLNATREQQILSLEGALRRIRDRLAKESENFHRIEATMTHLLKKS